MTGKRWDAASVTTQLRLTSLRLGQLQERQDSQGVITRKDIATLLQQRNVSLARVKAQTLQREDASGDLLEVLGMYVGQLLEHFQELDQSTRLSRNVIEAASTVIYAAQYVGLKDLKIVSNLLAQHLGPDFARSAVTNNDGHVAAIAIRTTTTLPPSAKDLDLALQRIAVEHGITWTPEPLRQDILKPVSEILDPQTAPVLDLPNLRRLCRRGIPDEPRWLRPRIWKLLFGVLPVVKASWTKDIESQRSSYYGLVQQLLDPLTALSPPDSASSPLDAMLLDISRQLSTTPSSLFGDLAQAPGPFSSCPLDDDAKDEIKLKSAKNLNLRLDILHATSIERTSLLPDKSSPMVITTPEISLSSPDVSQGEESNGFTTTLLSFKPFAADTVHPKHFNALLRLLYVHASINPGNMSRHIASLLVPLYAVLNHEVIPDDLAHVEADTFWLFEAMVGEFSELEDAEGRSTWMKQFSDRLAWADSDLFNGLQSKGLDPTLPHYSYQWLAPLLTHTLPLSSVLPIWDAIFSCPTRTRDVNPKVDHLFNVCTAMLIRVREILFRLGKNDYMPPSLWSEEQILHPPISPLHPWESGDAFMEGLAFLQHYPVEAAGGIDRILQDAFDLALRRDEETKLSQKETPSLGTRIRATMWKGFTNQEPSPDTSPEESEDELTNETCHEEDKNAEAPNNAMSGLTSRLVTTVWRGITNQASMEPPPSPDPPLSPSTSFSASIINPTESHRKGSLDPKSNIWAYTDKIRDSDTMAAIAKASSNWRARSILGLWGESPSLNGQEPSWFSQSGARKEINGEYSMGNDTADQSLSFVGRSRVYSPPSRPRHFQPPQDSFISHDKTHIPKEEGDTDELINRTNKSQLSLTALIRTSSSQASAKSGPRPLLLSPSTLLTSPPIQPVSRSVGSSPAPDSSQWVDVMRLKGHSLHRDSMSSVSSLSPSDTLRSTQSSRNGWDSDTGTSSRRIPLNRKSVSPMAPSFRRQGRSESFAMSSNRGLPGPPLSDRIDLKSWKHAEKLDSAIFQPSGMLGPTVIQEPRKTGIQSKDPEVSAASSNQDIMPKKLIGQIVPPTISRVNDTLDLSTAQTSSLNPTAIQEPRNNGIQWKDPGLSAVSSNQDTMPKELIGHIVPPTISQVNDTLNLSTAQTPSRSPRLRTRRYAHRPLDLNLENNTRHSMEQKSSNSNRLAVDWPLDDRDPAITPRAPTFEADDSHSFTSSKKASAKRQERLRKTSTDHHETQIRKASSGQRPRKSSSNQRNIVRRRESPAKEGDDEGYDDLLSAYESENSQTYLR